ncbi:MAG: hypothetical protein A2075_00615 [Geobacteraceae bacterium GWC2_58_44]|nr:MAG: hypothetical protein A2075_00615 [Geobacteraceae bacterium GWC2_58_44]HBG06508.1 chemotaxis protein CheR [Geobacter sp.]
MSQRISDSTLSMLSSFVASQMGLIFPRERWSDLEKGMLAAAPHFGFSDAGECIRWLMSAPLTRPQVEILAGFLTVGESYFFRDPQSFKAVETEILPRLLSSRRGKDQQLRIWSAGCSSGEEPYSLAILLHRMLPDLEQWRVTILGTDINPAALRHGTAGVYGKWSFRGTPPWLKSLYFTAAEEGRFRVIEPVRRLVSFEYLNLAEDSYPSLFTNTNAMDLIFCRNVLMYFTREMVRTVVAKLYRSLVEEGCLVVGPVEYWQESYQPLQAVSFDTVTFFRKRGGEPEATQEPASPAPQERAPVPTEPAARLPRRPEGRPLGGGQASSVTAQPLYETAAQFYRQGLYPQAVALLTGLSGREEISLEAITMLIKAQANQGKLSEAMSLCEEALKGNKLDPALHHLRAEILQEQGEVEEARASLERAIYLDPQLVLAHFALGNLALWGGRKEKARKHFQNALELLGGSAPEEILPGSEGMTAGRLREIILQITAAPQGAEGKRSSG